MSLLADAVEARDVCTRPWAQDLQLPADIWPAAGASSPLRRVFLTGATGFLGSELLAHILRSTPWDVVCLVRAQDAPAAQERVIRTLQQVGLDPAAVCHRVRAVAGDAAEPRYGLSEERFDQLAGEVDALIHGAAEVSWIKPYLRLRESHVLGTLNAVRLACRRRPKPLYAVSSLAVCYAADAPKAIDERTDMSAHIAAMPMGYAQAKGVTEALLQQAAARNLPVAIIRPGLLCGHSVTGRANHTDLVARLLRACIRSGITADVDWQLDSVPVDTAAQAIVAMLRSSEASRGTARSLHLHHPAPRSWRELMLTLRLYGYPIRMIQLSQWLTMLDQDGARAVPDLYALRAFLLADDRQHGAERLTLRYLEPARRRIQSAHSHAWLAQHGIGMPALDACLIQRYLDYFVERGFLPAVPQTAAPSAARTAQRTASQAARQVPSPGTPQSVPAQFEAGWRRIEDSAALTLEDLSAERLERDSGLLSELSAIQSRGATGLWRCRGRVRDACTGATRSIDAVLKLRPARNDQNAMAQAIADLCSPAVAQAFRDHLDALALDRAAEREAAIARMSDIRLQRHMPATVAVTAPEDDGRCAIAFAYLHDVELLDSVRQPARWTAEHLDAAARGLGEIHAVWLDRTAQLGTQPWIAPAARADVLPAMRGLWTALADFAAPRLSEILGATVGAGSSALLHRWIESMPDWWAQAQAMPRSLIHHDCNPRNLAFWRSAEGLTLCAYDWELATVGLPQTDLVELLCFVLPEQNRHAALERVIGLHRTVLAQAAGRPLDARQWWRGVAHALRYFSVCRLPLYMMIDRFRAQPYLPHVVKNAAWLASFLDLDEI